MARAFASSTISRSTAVVAAMLTLTALLCPLCTGERTFSCPSSRIVHTSCVTDRDTKTGEILRVGLTFNDMEEQSYIDDYMARTYAANPDVPHGFLEVDDFRLKGSILTTLDLTSLTRCKIVHLHITGHKKLTAIKRSEGANKMRVEEVEVGDTPVTNADVGNLLSYMNPKYGPTKLSIKDSSKMTNNQPGSPLIPDIATYILLEELHLDYTRITELKKGAFMGVKSMKKLTITNNELEFLPEDVFKDILAPKGPVTKLNVKQNHFICDDRMKWIKSKRITAEIEGVDCANDKGKTIFTTDKVGEPKDGATVVSLSSCLFFLVVLKNVLYF